MRDLAEAYNEAATQFAPKNGMKHVLMLLGECPGRASRGCDILYTEFVEYVIWRMQNEEGYEILDIKYEFCPSTYGRIDMSGGGYSSVGSYRSDVGSFRTLIIYQ